MARTQLELDDEIYKIVSDLATERGQSVGTIVSELLRELLIPDLSDYKCPNGYPLFKPSRFTIDELLDADDD